jgi:hypothetical protein
MKKALLPLLLASPLIAAAGELEQCEQIFRDNMEIMVFTMPCPNQQTDALPPEKFDAHLRTVNRCEALLAGKYAAQKEAVQSRLHAFTAPRAREVGRILDKPQQMQAYCTKQNATARRLLMKY